MTSIAPLIIAHGIPISADQRALCQTHPHSPPCAYICQFFWCLFTNISCTFTRFSFCTAFALCARA